MTGTDPEVPLSGRTVIVGSTNVGKTWLTAAVLDEWLGTYGPEGVVVLDFAPEITDGDEVIGGRLTRESRMPAEVWYGVLEAVGPRAEGESVAEALGLARRNACGARGLVRVAPDPLAVFVNDASIAFGHPDAAVVDLLGYCETAEVAVLNSYEGDELGAADHPVSVAEAGNLERLREWADRVIQLGENPDNTRRDS